MESTHRREENAPNAAGSEPPDPLGAGAVHSEASSESEARVSHIATILRTFMLPVEMIGEERVSYGAGSAVSREDRVIDLARRIDVLCWAVADGEGHARLPQLRQEIAAIVSDAGVAEPSVVAERVEQAMRTHGLFR